MNRPVDRNGATRTVVIGTLFGILLLPILIILLLGFTYLQSRSVMQEAHARSRLAEQQARLARSRAMMRPAVMSEDEAVTVDAADDSFTPAQPAVTETRSVPNADAIESPDGTVLRPVLRTVYETQQQTIQRAVTDPTTGETQFVTEKRPVVVPRTITEYVAVPATRHSAEVMKLVEELRKMGEEDPQRATKLSELKDLLLEEFSERHAQQGKEIERTQERLDKLRRTHQQRDEVKDKIVQRRIDQLLGQPDVLQWDSGSPPRLNAPLAPQPTPWMRQTLPPNTSYAPSQANDNTSPIPPLPRRPLVGPSPQLPRAQNDQFVPDRPGPSAPGSSDPGSRDPDSGYREPPAPGSRSDFNAPTLRPEPLSPPQLNVPQPDLPRTPPQPYRPQLLAPNAGKPIPGAPIPAQPSLRVPEPRGPNSDAPVPLPPADFERAVRPDATSRLPARNLSDAGSFTSNDLYGLAKELSAAQLTITDSAKKLEQMKKLAQKGLLPQSELRNEQARLEMAERELALLQSQWQSFEKRIEREQRYAESHLQRAEQRLSVARARFAQGDAKQTDILEAEESIEQATKRLEDIKDLKGQLNRINELIAAEDVAEEEGDAEEAVTSPGGETLQQTEAESPENPSTEDSEDSSSNGAE